ncbi:hypothetical protein N0V88_001825 [Collariella sp. IMI 366227]|nr:hypothetical protein N0V88_001825 [Collariella sp. IMI 366227]
MGKQSTPKTIEDGSAAKRRKFSHTPTSTTTTTAGPAAASPATPLYDQQAIQAAIEEEEKKRLAAVEKRAAELGDSHWVLEGAAAQPRGAAKPLLNVVQVGFAQIDYGAARGGYEDDDPFDFGVVVLGVVKEENDESGSGSESGSESGSGSDEDDSDDETSTPHTKSQPSRGLRDISGDAERRRGRSSMSQRREEERKKAQELAGRRRKKEVKLNQLSSISGGSQAFGKPAGGLTCHGCGKPGHKVAECPNKKR